MMDYIRQCFSTNLKIRRAIMRLSQEDLAELSRVSAGYIANLETGRSFPSTKVLLKLSKAFRVEHWKLLMDPEKDEIAYTREELSMIFDRAKSYILGDLPTPYSAPRILLDSSEEKP
jgi:transcriptional regulator with XRE-family HTH domain